MIPISISFQFSACGWFPAPFIKEAIFPLFWTPLSKSARSRRSGSFLSSPPFGYVYVFVPAPYCFCHRGFVIYAVIPQHLNTLKLIESGARHSLMWKFCPGIHCLVLETQIITYYCWLPWDLLPFLAKIICLVLDVFHTCYASWNQLMVSKCQSTTIYIFLILLGL